MSDTTKIANEAHEAGYRDGLRRAANIARTLRIIGEYGFVDVSPDGDEIAKAIEREAEQ